MRCRHCGRALKDAVSQARGVGPECMHRVSSQRSRRLDVLQARSQQGDMDAAFAGSILRRLEEGRALSPRMDRFLNQLLTAQVAEELEVMA